MGLVPELSPPSPVSPPRRLGLPAFLSALLFMPTLAGAQERGPFRGPYLGQAPPGRTPVLFAPGFFLNPGEYHSPIVFSPEGTEAYWSPMPGHGRNTTLMAEMVDGVWTTPRYVDFGLEAGATEVTYSPDGGMVYFLSTQLFEGERPTDGPRERIWFATRDPDGSVGPPRIMPPTVTAHSTHWQFSVAANGNLYFTSRSSGTQSTDILVARYSRGTYGEPQPLGAGVNSTSIEHCPFVAPDESYLLFTRNDEEHDNRDLFVSYRTPEGSWSEAEPLPAPINSEHTEIYPVISPDGEYLFFLSWREGAGRMFWIGLRRVRRP
jgi:hypothetical protein